MKTGKSDRQSLLAERFRPRALNCQLKGLTKEKGVKFCPTDRELEIEQMGRHSAVEVTVCLAAHKPCGIHSSNKLE